MLDEYWNLESPIVHFVKDTRWQVFIQSDLKVRSNDETAKKGDF